MMRALIFAAAMLAVLVGAATLSGCLSGQGQQSLSGASHDWSRANAVPAGLVGGIIRAGGTRRK
jgi:hypothetical protein